jgi:hypothetical protein
VEHFRQVLIAAVIAGPGGLFLPRLPVRWLSFEKRRVLALVLAVIWTLVFIIWVYLRLWVWDL